MCLPGLGIQMFYHMGIFFSKGIKSSPLKYLLSLRLLPLYVAQRPPKAFLIMKLALQSTQRTQEMDSTYILVPLVQLALNLCSQMGIWIRCKMEYLNHLKSNSWDVGRQESVLEDFENSSCIYNETWIWKPLHLGHVKSESETWSSTLTNENTCTHTIKKKYKSNPVFLLQGNFW